MALAARIIFVVDALGSLAVVLGFILTRDAREKPQPSAPARHEA